MAFEWAKDAEPNDLRWEEDNTIVGVSWNDGHESRYPLPYLRVNCPCALCRNSHANPPIRVDTAEDQSRPALEEHQDSLTAEQKSVRRAYPIGNYAIGITWQDGHDDGIFTWKFLRGMCPCDKCMARQAEELLTRSEDGS
jgi:DUF971 family protein